MMRKKNSLFNSGFIALIACFLLITSGYAQAPCTNTSISSFFPSSGPVGTVVTLTGTGFNLGSGTSSVKFNGTEAAAFTVVSATTIKATVPEWATNGAITIITNGCSATMASFTVMTDNCNEVYISEVYDATTGNPGAIEIYNPTGNTIVFNNQYVLERYQNIGNQTPVTGYVINLPGSIGSEETYLILSGDAPCGIPDDRPLMGNGINADDEFKLLKNGSIIDVLQVQGGTGDDARGYTMIRKPYAVGPSRSYSNNDWFFYSTESCADIGSHLDLPTPITPQGATICQNSSYTFTATSDITTVYTYQWKMLNAAGNWVNVTNGGNYSGATTISLTINNIPASFNGNQYYCEIGAGNCTLPSHAAQLIVIPTLATVVATSTATDCATQTATVTITSTLPAAGITYSIDGGAPQASNIFNGVAASALAHTITVTDTNGTCPPVTGTITIAPATTLPAVVATSTATDCATQTATVTVTSTLPATGITYSIDGGTPQASNVFNGVAASALAHTITITDTNGTCPAVTGTITIAPVTTLPAVVATATATDCTTQTATVTVTSTLPATGITYSIDGGASQASNVFNGVAASALAHTITVTDTNGTCPPVTGTITIAPATTLPAVVATATATDCATQTATVTVTSTLPAPGITYSIDGGTPQASNVFNGITASALAHTITITDTNGTCPPVTGTITIAPATTLPAVVATTTATDCATQTATVTVTSTLPATGITYSIDGGAPQVSNVFNGVAASALAHTITITDTNGTCLPVTGTITIALATTLPAVVATATATDCATQTATVTVNSTLPATGITYSIDGGTPQASNVFNGVTASALAHTITITDTNGTCPPVTGTITIAPATTLPAVVATSTATDCATQTATVTVTSTLPATGITYSIDGGTPQASNVFNGVAASALAHTITITDTNGACPPVTGTIIIAPVTTLPAVVATATATDCATQTATVTITSTLPATGITYSIDGGTPQASNIFNGITASALAHIITVTDTNGTCPPVSGTITVAPVTTLPAVVATTTATDCATQTATVTVTSTLPATGITYSIDGGTPQASNVFNGITASALAHTITVTDNNGTCPPVNGSLTILPVITPQITGVQECRETTFGRNYVLEALPIASSFDVSTATFEWRRTGQTTILGNDNIFNVTQYALANGIEANDFPIDFEVTVITPGGCRDTALYNVTGIFCDIPKGISPNNDTKNDTFDLTGLNVTHLSIFNRYGLEVYNRGNYTNEWHGQENNGNELPTGTYFYVVKTENESKTGWVYLNRQEN